MQHKPYTTTELRTRNHLWNIVYNGVFREGFYNRNFVFDIYVLLTKNLNPFFLERKIANQNMHEMIYMLWRGCIPAKFYRFLCQGENFLYLNGKNVLHPRTSDMFRSFISQDDMNYNLLRHSICRFKDIFQFAYSITYPYIYCSTEHRGFNLKSHFNSFLKRTRIKKNRVARERSL